VSEDSKPDYSYDPNSGAVAQPGGYGSPGATPLPKNQQAGGSKDPNPAAKATSKPDDKLQDAPEGAGGEGAVTGVNQLLSDAGTPQASPAAEESAGEETPNEPAPEGEPQDAPSGAAEEGAQTEVNQLLSDAGAPEDASVPQEGADGGEQDSVEQQEGTPGEPEQQESADTEQPVEETAPPSASNPRQSKKKRS
jgi:hypothetical protein